MSSWILIKAMKFSLCLCMLLSLKLVLAADLKPFKSDGCSAFPDGTLTENELWLNCCTQHDLAYWQGGSSEQRNQADLDLKTCVAEVGKPMIAALMLAGVRVGGTPYLPTRFRWAYGWPYPRGYKVLSPAELVMVNTELQNYKATQSDR